MSNELTVISKLETMMQDLISMNMDTAKSIERIDRKVDTVEKRMNDFENNSEITTQQRNTVRRTVNAQVYKLLGLPEKKSSWNLDDKVKAKKYSQLFHQRCYSEVSKKGHLSAPYGTTTSQNFIAAVNDIEAWTPSNGIAGLMAEADENAMANRIAKEEGYVR